MLTESEIRALILHIERQTEIMEAATARERKLLQEVRAMGEQMDRMVSLIRELDKRPVSC